MSLERLREHRRLWRQKPVLARVYGAWFDAILSELPQGARVLEVGAGPGFFAEHSRRSRPDLRWIASDLVGTPWNDVAADALKLPLRSESIDAVVGLDFLHHLAHPADFFREARRVLAPSGRLVAIEPWLTPFSYPVYRFLHHERCRLRLDPWDPFSDTAAKDAFDGDSGLVRALVRRTSAEQWRQLGLLAPRVHPLNAFAYLLSLGFKPSCLLPYGAARALIRLDEAGRALAPWLGLRTRLVWERARPHGGC